MKLSMDTIVNEIPRKICLKIGNIKKMSCQSIFDKWSLKHLSSDVYPFSSLLAMCLDWLKFQFWCNENLVDVQIPTTCLCVIGCLFCTLTSVWIIVFTTQIFGSLLVVFYVLIRLNLLLAISLLTRYNELVTRY